MHASQSVMHLAIPSAGSCLSPSCTAVPPSAAVTRHAPAAAAYLTAAFSRLDASEAHVAAAPFDLTAIISILAPSATHPAAAPFDLTALAPLLAAFVSHLAVEHGIWIVPVDLSVIDAEVVCDLCDASSP